MLARRHTQQCVSFDGAEVRLQIAPRFTRPMPIHATVRHVLLYPLLVSLPLSAKSANNSNSSAHTVVRLHTMTSPHFWGLPDTQQAHASIGQKNCPSAAGKRGDVMSLRSRRLVCGTLPRRGYTVHRQFFTAQRRYSCANGSVLTTILLRHKNAWPWDASLDTCNSDENDSHASITNGNENRFRSFRLKKRDDKIIFGLSEKPDRENVVSSKCNSARHPKRLPFS